MSFSGQFSRSQFANSQFQVDHVRPDGGFDFIPKRKRRPKPTTAKAIDIAEVYAQLYESAPPATMAEARAVVTPYQDTPTQWAPPPSQVDFAALAADVASARRLVDLYHRTVIDDEDTFFMLTIH